MAFLPIGSEKILEIHTGKVNIVIKSKRHRHFPDPDKIPSPDSSLEIRASALERVTILGNDQVVGDGAFGMGSYHFNVCPLFFEQTDYEIIVESPERAPVSFWHENLNIREKISPVTESDPGLLTGVINFGDSIGHSDFEILVSGTRHIVIRIEVFPSVITYKEDYRNMLSDISDEICSFAVDYLKPIDPRFQHEARHGSDSALFFQIIRNNFNGLIRAVNKIITAPHLRPEVDRRMSFSHSAGTIDYKGNKRFIRRREYLPLGIDGIDLISTAAQQKKITCDTTVNKFAGSVLKSTAKMLDDFRARYSVTRKTPDPAVLRDIDRMIGIVRQLISDSFLSDMSEYRSVQFFFRAFGMVPDYRELYKYFLLLKRGLSVNGDIFHLSVKDTARLYEYWCFIRMVGILKRTIYRGKDGTEEKKFRLVSADIFRMDDSGITVFPVFGKKTEIRFLNVLTGDVLSLTYSPGVGSTQTVEQRRRSVLILENTGLGSAHKHIFCPCYRLGNDPERRPGPDPDDINLMHRYRDSVIYEDMSPCDVPVDKTTVGAYVLFPGPDEKPYTGHRFYKSIESFNIGGLPFMPGVTRLTESLLSGFITESEKSSFERTPLPPDVRDRLAGVDWDVEDVLVGSFRTEAQFRINFERKFYYAPVANVKTDKFPIRYIAMYRPKYWNDPGIRYYGEVTDTYVVKRKEIPVPMRSRNNGDEPYFIFKIKEWSQLPFTIEVKEEGVNEPKYTNLFLLGNCRQSYELFNIHSEKQYLLLFELRCLCNDALVCDIGTCPEPAFKPDAEHMIRARDGFLDLCNNKGEVIERTRITDFVQRPKLFFLKIIEHLKER